MKTNDEEIIEFVEQLQSWHEHQIKQLKLVVSQGDCQLVIGEKTILAGSELAKGIKIVVNISLGLFGELPSV